MIVDVSVPLRPDLPHWPNEDGFRRHLVHDLAAGASATVSSLLLGAHVGTHMDAPVHFLEGGDGIDAVDLDACVGPGWVADLTALERPITADDLEAAGIPDGIGRLLAKTRNSGWSRDASFREDFVAYDASAAEWCLRRGMVLVGIDYLSIEPYGSGAVGHPVHHALLRHGVVIVEGIELADVEPGPWEVVALPLRIVGGDGSPARVVLRR